MRLAAHGFHDKRPTRMALLHHDGRVLVAGIGHAGNTYEGRLGPDGRRGKHQLYLDAESADTLAEDVVEEGSSARGIPTGPVVGHHVQLWLRSRNGGELALQLEGEVFTEGLGEISVRARVRDSAPAQ